MLDSRGPVSADCADRLPALAEVRMFGMTNGHFAVAAGRASATIALFAFLFSSHVVAEPTIAPIEARLASADSSKGKTLFLQCAVCHVSKAGAVTTIGPNLWNVVGRRIAVAPRFDYSDSLKQIGGDWDFEQLNVYLFDPKLVAPEGSMPFTGIKSANERAHLIAYLVTLSDEPVALPDVADSEADHLVGETGFAGDTSDDSAKWQGLPPGPGREDVFYRCKACHSLMIVKQQGLSRDAWDESLEWMVEEQGMSPFEDENTRNQILDYLSVHFGLN
jgi:cytochrome c